MEMIKAYKLVDLKMFEKQEKIGSGGYSKVYKVCEKKTGKIFSAKVLLNELDESRKEEFLNLKLTTIQKILSNDKLLLKDEDELIEFINYLNTKDSNKFLLHLNNFSIIRIDIASRNIRNRDCSNNWINI